MTEAYKSDYERWFATAEEDLLAAQSNLREEAHPWACYIAQQAAEKALKAYLLARGEELPRIHMIKKLLERCGKYDEEFLNDVDTLKQLDSHYVPTRYPNGLSDGTPGEFFNGKDAANAIELAGKIVNLVKLKL